jgi:hypothetical protein
MPCSHHAAGDIGDGEFSVAAWIGDADTRVVTREIRSPSTETRLEQV